MRLSSAIMRVGAAAALAFLPLGSSGQEAGTGSPFAGTWRGVLDTGPASITVIFRIGEADGGLVGSFDSPDQGAFDIAISSIRATAGDGADSVFIESQAVQGSFAGELSEDRMKIVGTWSQGIELPLELVRQPNDESPAAARDGFVPPARHE
ncbi:MAG: hypothetical protein J4G12_05100 [Gemmatimonadetes bacterium]|nr:hypothetical protein [Gemmatimonadota bacterium]